MQPKILSIKKAEYIPVPWNGKNESGYSPLGDRVLVLPDIAAGKVGSIELTQDVQERAQLSASSGVLVELGDDAFRWNFDRSRPWDGYRPKAGDRIAFDRYAGKEIIGDDAKVYRLMDDKCIGGVRRKDEKA